jgi:lycopene cyclase domain-containing protein
MTYTAITVVAVLTAVALDRWGARTRLTSTRTWWSAYGIIVFFQLLTNGWLTGRGIVQYDPDAIIGDGSVPLVGDGRLVFAPVEDLGFGFALVLTSCVVWVWLGRRSGEEPREEAGEEAGERTGGGAA